ncbi:hypothetical protein P43SY_010111 [Pythium insidiosum]|uniref:ADP-ribosylation factor-related protein n=1 Tax=Pythium insidiosum TaxID=114742 RepID=A0AAD5Q308_PYTIN|nr:hypothetical protein P43SY_010111 [Pythium insidiosum]
MFSLFMGLWNYLFSKAELHLLIVGLDDAGKTTILEQLKGIFGKKPGIPLDKIPPTVGLNLARVDIRRCRVICWDLGGQERLRVIWSKYYSESHGIVFVVDSANEQRLDEAKQTLQTLLSHAELADIPLLLLANKKDLENAHSVEAIRDRMDIEGHSGPLAAHSTCALTREGIEVAMNWLVDVVKTSDRFDRHQAASTTT